MRWAALVLLAAGTIGIHAWLDRWQPIGPQLVQAQACRPASDAWQRSQQGGLVSCQGDDFVLTLTDPDGIVTTWQHLDVLGLERVEVQAVVSSDADEAIYAPRVTAVQQDTSPRSRWDLPHASLLAEGTPRRLSRALQVQPAIERLHLSLQIRDTPGRLTVRELSVRAVEMTGTFFWSHTLLVIGWGLLAIAFVHRWRSASKPGIFRWLALALGAVIVFGSSTPGGLPREIKSLLQERTITETTPAPSASEPRTGDPTPRPSLPPVTREPKTKPPLELSLRERLAIGATKKIGHVALFACLALAALAAARIAPSRIACALCGFAIGVETFQLHVPDRSPMLTDATLNISGLVAGCLVWLVIRRWMAPALPTTRRHE